MRDARSHLSLTHTPPSLSRRTQSRELVTGRDLAVSHGLHLATRDLATRSISPPDMERTGSISPPDFPLRGKDPVNRSETQVQLAHGSPCNSAGRGGHRRQGAISPPASRSRTLSAMRRGGPVDRSETQTRLAETAFRRSPCKWRSSMLKSKKKSQLSSNNSAAAAGR